MRYRTVRADAMKINFGVHILSGDFPIVAEMTRRADELGYYSVSMGDHLLSASGLGSPKLEVFTTLSALAALTTRIRLAPMVTAPAFRNPGLLAKMFSTIDNISGGRFIAGLGAGWMREEYKAFGYRFGTHAARLEELYETIQVLKAMWTDDEPTYQGRHFTIERAYNYPRPVQKPYPPILVGGNSAGLIKLAARQADIFNIIRPLPNNRIKALGKLEFDKSQLKQRIGLLRSCAQDAGRDPNSVEVSVFVTSELRADRAEADDMVRRVARKMQFGDDLTAVRQSPGMLVGTPEDLRREIRDRYEQFGTTYYVISFLSNESFELFGQEVIPAFNN